MKISSGSLLLVTALVLVPVRVHQQGSGRAITIDTSEVTTPAVAVTPDGRTLVFSAIGHLYELPVAGGATTQLTFGPSYDFDPAMSPDGSRVAFASNRDGSGSNIFVLDRASKRVTQVSREVEAARPVWSPDGKTIAYARNVLREDHSMELMPGFADNGLRDATRYQAGGGRDHGMLLGAGVFLWIVWIGTTSASYLAGALVRDPARYGLDVLMPIFFAAMLVSLWQGARLAIPWAVAGVVALAAQALTPGYLFIIVGALAGMLAGAFADGD